MIILNVMPDDEPTLDDDPMFDDFVLLRLPIIAVSGDEGGDDIF